MLSVYCPGIKVRGQALIDLLLYMIAGVFVGLTSGLFGLGGGVVMVPAMLPIFAAQGMSVDVAMHVAVASSLATIVFTGVSSAHAHWRLGNVVFSVLPWLVLGLVLGALTGAQIAAALSGQALRFIFGLFLIVFSLRLFFGGQPDSARGMPTSPVVTIVGFLIGCLSSLVGIGGGTMVVPFLLWTGVVMRQAVGTSAAAGISIAVAGSIGFVWAGTGDDQLPAYSTGYIYWPAVFGVAVSSVIFAPIGARLASRLPARLLQRGFAIFLALVGLRLLLS